MARLDPVESQQVSTTMREVAENVSLRAELAVERENVDLLQESIADLELAMEDRNWLRMSVAGSQEFSREGLGRASDNARIYSIANPLIKRGLNLRAAYVWGQGVSVAARATGAEGSEQDVNAVVQAFWDDESNRAALTSGQAAEELERTGLGCDGNVMLACFTNPRTGRVQVRVIAFAEIAEKICNPEDKDDPWFYKREWSAQVVEAGYSGLTRTRRETRRAYYPAMGYRPRTRPRSIDGIDVYWDAPVLHLSANRLSGWMFGIGDAYAALAWARGYKEFLEDWARLMKALSRFAWRLSSDRSTKARAAGARLAQVTSQDPDTDASQAGATAAYGPGVTLEAIPKSGATLDSESGKPLAAMVAAALGVPVTMLLADPGITGARAVADTLDQPTELEMGMRRTLWGDALRRLLDYVVDQAVRAPAGPLKGMVSRDEDGREVVELAGDTERTVDIVWPDLTDESVKDKVAAIVDADSTDKMPPPTTARLLLEALGVEDVDEILEEMTDDDGNWVDPDASAGQAAMDRFRRGEPPIGGEDDPSEES